MLTRWLLVCALVTGLIFAPSTMAVAMTAPAAADHCADDSDTSDQTPTKQMRCAACAAVEVAVPLLVARTTLAVSPRHGGDVAPLADILADHATPPPRAAA